MLQIATIDDAAAIAALIAPYIADFATDSAGAEKFNMAMIAKLIASDSVIYYVAKDKATQVIIGVIAYKKPAHLLHFFVAKAHQHHGIGKKMWLAIELQMWQNHMDANDTGEVVISVNSSLAAQGVYERFGFVATSPIQEQAGLRYIQMQKNKPLF